MNSANRTYLSRKIVEDERKLEIGDIVEIGDTALVFTNQREIPVKSVTDYDNLRALSRSLKMGIPAIAIYCT